MAGYPTIIGDGMTQMQAYAKLLEPNGELTQKSLFVYPTLSDLSSYPPPILLPPTRYPTLIPPSVVSASNNEIPATMATMASYQVLNTNTKTTDSVQNPITRTGDPTYPVSNNKVNIFTSPSSYPTMQAGFSLSPNLLLVPQIFILLS